MLIALKVPMSKDCQSLGIKESELERQEVVGRELDAQNMVRGVRGWIGWESRSQEEGWSKN